MVLFQEFILFYFICGFCFNSDVVFDEMGSTAKIRYSLLSLFLFFVLKLGLVAIGSLFFFFLNGNFGYSWFLLVL